MKLCKDALLVMLCFTAWVTLLYSVLAAGLAALIDAKTTKFETARDTYIPLPLTLVTTLGASATSNTTANPTSSNATTVGSNTTSASASESSASASYSAQGALQTLDFGLFMGPSTSVAASNAASWCSNRMLKLSEDTAWPSAAQLASASGKGDSSVAGSGSAQVRGHVA
jgi:hypothetical protein